MNKLILMLISVMVLTACSDTEPSTSKEVKEEVTTDTESTEAPITEPPEKNEFIEPETELSELTPLTLEDFNNRYELDADYGQFVEGKFELKDGSIVYADWHSYLEGETFDYVSAKFVEGEVVQLQVDIKPGTTKEQVLKEFGLHEKEVTYDMSPNQIVVDIVVDPTFDDANISRLPNEWD